MFPPPRSGATRGGCGSSRRAARCRSPAIRRSARRTCWRAIGEITLDGASDAIVFEEGVGPVPVTIRARAAQPDLRAALGGEAARGRAARPTRETLATMLSLEPDDLLGGHWSPQRVSCGLPFLFVPGARSRRGRASRACASTSGSGRSGNAWAPMVFVFARDAGARRARTSAPGCSRPASASRKTRPPAPPAPR